MIEHHTLSLIRQDLCARLAPLDRYGLANFASVLVDGVLALTNRSKVLARGLEGFHQTERLRDPLD
jgi:hypothetical protein